VLGVGVLFYFSFWFGFFWWLVLAFLFCLLWVWGFCFFLFCFVLLVCVCLVCFLCSTPFFHIASPTKRNHAYSQMLSGSATYDKAVRGTEGLGRYFGMEKHSTFARGSLMTSVTILKVEIP